jgi:NFU1 iron-sulfur cluster scaffold homolog, mitochondrial
MDEDEIKWKTLRPEIFAVIMDFYASNLPVIDEKLEEEMNKESGGVKEELDNGEDSETIALIKELLDSRIRPTVQEDGGDITYVVGI